MLYRDKSGNVYVVCETIAPPADSATKHDYVVVLAQQSRGDGKPLDGSELGTFQVFRSELDDEYEQVA